ncbi:MAG TPA: FKBP-type peptidyl-prolyl cis-trans isomerase [Candidatus Dormibacteraeota bacterium]|nr:FKBP-type peptidyl-prolyl cis-trans isomerase [Candidatus Dormibacteraeota bacterium]
MNRRGFRLPFAAAFAVAVLAGCGGDELPTPTPPTSSGGSASTPAACVSAPSVAAVPDKFTDSVALTTLPDGLQYGDFVVGTGPAPTRGANVTVQYTGWLTNGTMFDSSRQSGRTPFAFAIGTNAVIKGWDEGVLSMHIGGKRRLVIPPALGYGAQANGPIPANSTLVFDVTLLAIGCPAAS